jgi:hypothetical protein
MTDSASPRPRPPADLHDVGVARLPPAIDERATASALHRYFLRGLSAFVAGVIGLVVSFSLRSDAQQRQTDLERDGEVVIGEVASVIDTVFGPDGFDYLYEVDGSTYVATIQPGNQREVGDPLIVHVDPFDPTRSTVADERPQGVTAFRVMWTTFVFGVAGVAAGLVTFVGTRALSVVLRSAPWEIETFDIRRRRLGGAELIDEADGVSMSVDRRHVRLLQIDGPAARLRIVRRGRLGVVAPVLGRPRLVAGRLRSLSREGRTTAR